MWKFWYDGLAWSYLEDLFEIVTAGWQDYFVSPDTLFLTDQGHVYELIFVLQFADTVDDVGLVVGPLDTELGAGHGDVGGDVDEEEEGGVSPILFYISRPDLPAVVVP